MQIGCKRLFTLSGGVLLACLTVSTGAAQCGGYQPSAPSRTGVPGRNVEESPFRASITKVSTDANAGSSSSIVGFWHVKFVSEGTVGIPDGTEVDAGYSQWHSDGTEFLNSGSRAPLTGNFCLGVWAQVGPYDYTLNHFAIAWDPTGTSLVGPGHIKENVVLNPNGQTFTGSFSIDQYDESNNLLGHVQGNITGTRITVGTPTSPIF